MDISAPSTATSLTSLLLFLSHSLHVFNRVVLVCFQSSTIDLTAAILANDFEYVNSKWIVINNCATRASLAVLSELKEIPFIISIAESNGNETVKQIEAMLDTRHEIAHATHLVILNDPAANDDHSTELFLAFAKKFVLLHIVSWRNGLKLLTKRTWFDTDSFIRSGNISDDEHSRWADLNGALPYNNINYVMLCVPPFLIKTKGIYEGQEVTSVGGIEVETVTTVANQMRISPRFFAVDFTTKTSSEQCYDCVIRDKYYEHEYTVSKVKLPALKIEIIAKTESGIGFQDFQ